MSPPATADSAAEVPRSCAVLNVVEESDDYTSAVAGVAVEGIRVGKGVGPNVVLGVPGEQLTVTSSCFGFPMTAGAHVPQNRIVAAYVHRNPARSRWCGETLREGSVYTYTPGAEHTAINQPGLHFTFAVTDPHHLAAVADRLGFAIDIPCHRGLHEMPTSPSSRRLGARLKRLTTASLGGEQVERHSRSALVSFAELLAGDPLARPLDRVRSLSSRQIVISCIDYAEATDQIPTIAELCLAAHVSERRLRSAFAEEFDRSPTRYFRAWGLDRAHRELRDAAPCEHTVSQVACDLGFDHLGRFAAWYREMYGETPSATLHAG